MPSKGPRLPNFIECKACGHHFESLTAQKCEQCGTGPEHFKVRCGSRKRKKPETDRCKAFISHVGQRCDLHGRNNAKGPAHPRWDTGIYSKYRLPEAVAEVVNVAMEGEDLTSLKMDLALLEARRVEAIQKLGEDLPSEMIEEAIRHLQKPTPDVELALEALQSVQQRNLAWEEIVQVSRDKSKIVDVERRKIEAERRYITIEHLRMYIGLVASVVRRMLDDRQYGVFARELKTISIHAETTPTKELKA